MRVMERRWSQERMAGAQVYHQIWFDTASYVTLGKLCKHVELYFSHILNGVSGSTLRHYLVIYSVIDSINIY